MTPDIADRIRAPLPLTFRVLAGVAVLGLVGATVLGVHLLRRRRRPG